MITILENIGYISSVIGIISAFGSIIAWKNARKHSLNAIQSMKVIQNYRLIETFTEVNKKLEFIRLSIREVGISKSNNIQKRYNELENSIGDVIHSIPTANSELVEKIKEVELAIRIQRDKNEKLIGDGQYKVLDSIDFVKTGLKGLMEELRNGK